MVLMLWFDASISDRGGKTESILTSSMGGNVVGSMVSRDRLMGKPFTIRLPSARSKRTSRRDIGYAEEDTGWRSPIVGETGFVVIGFKDIGTSLSESESTVASGSICLSPLNDEVFR